MQDVLLDCLRDGGALACAERARATTFKSFIYGVSRIVALRYESRLRAPREGQFPAALDADDLNRSDDRVSAVFDRAWATMILQTALDEFNREATAKGSTAERRVEILRLRFYDEQPIRAIAARWSADAALIHHEYARARKEFKDVLLRVLARHGTEPRTEPSKVFEELLRLVRGDPV